MLAHSKIPYFSIIHSAALIMRIQDFVKPPKVAPGSANYGVSRSPGKDVAPGTLKLKPNLMGSPAIPHIIAIRTEEIMPGHNFGTFVGKRNWRIE